MRDMDELAAAVRAFRDARDWRQFHNPKDLALSVSLEAAELLEHFQWKDAAEVQAYAGEPENRTEMAHEMADILILLLSLADVLDVDLHAATLAKLALNEQRYPVEQARGRATKYDRLNRGT